MSIIAFLLSWIFGAIALYFSYQVGAKWTSGDAAGSAKASRLAKIWGIVGICVGVVILLIALSSGS